MTLSPVAPDETNDNFLGLDYRVDVDALIDWATISRFVKGSIGFVMQEPEMTDDSNEFLIKMYGSNCRKEFCVITG